MGRILYWWKELGESPAVRIGLVINFCGVLVVLAGIIWGACWAVVQDKRNNMRSDVLTKSFKDQVNRLEEIHKTSVRELGEKFAKAISDVETRVNSFAERSDEMVLGETIRRIIAGQGNTERALKDVYEKALEEGLKGNYIFELNQVSDGVGFGVFVTELDLRSGRADANGSSYLLTYEEKKNIDKCLRILVAEVKREKQKDEFVNRSTQEEMFRFLLWHEESGIGCITEPLSRRIRRRTSYGKNRIEVMTPPAKLGAIIGYIGDVITHDG